MILPKKRFGGRSGASATEAQMKYVNRIEGKDGTVRLYFRKAGMPSVPLKSPMPPSGEEIGSALEAEVRAILASAAPKAQPSTLRAYLRKYELASADFAGLADSTKYIYRLLLKEMEEDFGSLHVSTFKAAYLLKLRETWAPRGHRAANLRMQVLKNALWPAVVEGKLGDGDPFALIPQVRRPRDAEEPHLIWPEAIVLAVIKGAIEEGRYGVARAVAIGRYVGARREDITRFTKSVRRGGRFAFLSGKKRVPVDMEEDAALTTVLAGTPSQGLYLVYNLEGLPYTPNGLYQAVSDLVGRLYKAKKIDSDRYDLHGLRHTFGVEAALAGCTDAEGAARMGHGSPHSFATYRRQADRIRLSKNAEAKIRALREQSPNGELQNALQNVCKTPVSRPARSRGKNARKSK
jgi:integrase